MKRLLALCLFCTSMHAGAADLVVIVAAHSTVAALRPDQVAAIFLGQTAQAPDGTDVVALDQPVCTPLRDEFYARVAHKSPALLKAYWSKLLFTGRGQPPREVADSAAVRRLVAETPGMIGYVDPRAVDGTVKVVMVVR